MTLQKTKDHLYDVVATFFQGATIIWSESNGIKPSLPLVRLKTGTVSMTAMPISHTDNGVTVSSYVARTILEVNLYTKGTPIGDVSMEGDRINTSVSDLLDFVSFISSTYATQLAEELNITIKPMGTVTDVSALLNDTSHEYRSMAEFVVEFIYESTGAAGMPTDWAASSSGGGTEELATMETGYFETVAIVKEESTT